MRPLILSSLVILLCTSCISKKNYLAEVANLESAHQMTVDGLQRDLRSSYQQIDTLRIKLAEQNGANDALFATQDKLQVRIDELQDQLRLTQTNSQSTAQDLTGTVRQKEQEIAALQQQLQAIGERIDQRAAIVAGVSSEISNRMYTFLGDDVLLDAGSNYVSVIFSEKLLFYPGSAERVRTAGKEALGNLALVILQHPELKVEVIGHTDNQPVKKYEDNWDFSALRSAGVVRTLVEEYEVSPNQITLVAKGEYSPRASNETSSGRTDNRRVEVRFTTNPDVVLREVRKMVGGTP